MERMAKIRERERVERLRRYHNDILTDLLMIMMMMTWKMTSQ